MAQLAAIAAEFKIATKGDEGPKNRVALIAELKAEGWVADDLPPYTVTTRTATRWLHDLGFDVKRCGKSPFSDGHEGQVEHRKQFIKDYFEYYEKGPNWFLDPKSGDYIDKDEVDNTEEFDKSKYMGLGGLFHPKYLKAAQNKTDPLHLPILCSHDESTCRTNDHMMTFWSDGSATKFKSKNEGASLMVAGISTEIFDGTIHDPGAQPALGVSNMHQLRHKFGPDMPAPPRPSSGEYEVEFILDKKTSKGRVEYCVKWLGYCETEATWEPEENCKGAAQAISDFEASVENKPSKYDYGPAMHADFSLRVGKEETSKGTASSKDGYWNSERFCNSICHVYEQFERMVAPLEKKLGVKFACVIQLDHSSGHTCMAKDALNAKNMNKGPGGKKGTEMRSTTWTDVEGRLGKKGKQHKQELVINGESIGAEACLAERGVATKGLKLDEIVDKLNEFDDFKAEVITGRAVERLTAEWNKRNGRQHKVMWVPKYHCELNWIERKWAFIKARIKEHTTGSMPGLIAAYNTVIQELSVMTCRKFARKARDYMRAYRDGAGISDIDKLVATKYKSHRRVFDSMLNILVTAAERKLTALEKKWADRTAKRKENEARRAREHSKEVKEKAARERRIARQEKSDPNGAKRQKRGDEVDDARARLQRKRKPESEKSEDPDCEFGECHIDIEVMRD